MRITASELKRYIQTEGGYGALFIHHKRPDVYRVDDIWKNCTNSQNGQTMVTYKSTMTTDVVNFVREIEEFCEKFKVYGDWWDVYSSKKQS